MRTAFNETLFELARHDERLFLLTGDMGFSVFEKFEAAYPGRYLNVGIAEANMAGIAAGLAMAGMNVYMYSIVPFATLRCLEQIRVDICYQNLPVTVVGVGAGLSYGPAGGSHQSLEDVAIMRALPGMSVSTPADPLEARRLTEFASRHDGPLYIRLGKNGERRLHEELPPLSLGRMLPMREGKDLTLFVSGALLETALLVCDRLEAHGLSTRLLSVPFVKPIDHEAVKAAAEETRHLFTLEEHSLIGGLGGAVSEVLAELGAGTRLTRLALPDAFLKDIGSQDYLRAKVGLDADSLVARIQATMAGVVVR